MKTVSRDRTHIDYTAERVGVRVRRSACRPLIFQRGRWVEYGVSYALPVALSLLEAHKTGISSLASNVSKVGEPEVRALISGETSFEEALDPPGGVCPGFSAEPSRSQPAHW